MASAGTKSRMKSMFNLMFDYAMAHEVVFTNYARNYKIDAEILEEKEKNKRLKQELLSGIQAHGWEPDAESSA